MTLWPNSNCVFGQNAAIFLFMINVLIIIIYIRTFRVTHKIFKLTGGPLLWGFPLLAFTLEIYWGCFCLLSSFLTMAGGLCSTFSVCWVSPCSYSGKTSCQIPQSQQNRLTPWRKEANLGYLLLAFSPANPLGPSLSPTLWITGDTSFTWAGCRPISIGSFLWTSQSHFNQILFYNRGNAKANALLHLTKPSLTLNYLLIC